MPKLEVNKGLDEGIRVFKVSSSTVRTLLKLIKTGIFPFIFYFIHDKIQTSHLVTFPQVAAEEVASRWVAAN